MNEYICILFYFVDPISVDVFERLEIVFVIDHDDAICPLVVGVGNGPESLLACSIPNLYFHAFPLHVQRFKPEVHSDCRVVRVVELVV